MNDDLLSRIDQYLTKPRAPATEPPANESLVNDPAAVVTPEQEADAALLKASLSGAFNEAIDIFLGEGEDAGYYLAEVPLLHFKACGLKLVESLVRPRVGSRDRGQCYAIVGSPDALFTAERRVAKPLGEGWEVLADSFPMHKGARATLYFRLKRKA